MLTSAFKFCADHAWFYTRGPRVVLHAWDTRGKYVVFNTKFCVNHAWISARGFSVEDCVKGKTELVWFTKNKKFKGEPKRLILDGQVIEPVKQVKYLGVILDKTLTWNPHLNKIIQKATTALFTLKRMASKNWGLKPEIMQWVYSYC